jgi:ribosome maturation factor RimP
MATADRLRELVVPLLDERGLRLYDLELAGGVVRVLVDRDGGADIDAISELTRAISRALDEADPIAGSYTLEVSTPGLERPLRTPEHFAGAVGTEVRIKTIPGTEGDRRVDGVVASADAEGVTIRTHAGDEPQDRRLRYAEIERARTVFEWGPATGNQKKRSRT